jgi:RNA polymerase sigma-70 factor (ECF subfamily)
MTKASGEITKLLLDMRNGNPEAEESLFALVYHELRRVAARQLRNERQGHTLQPTALVHEAYLQLLRQKDKDWKNRAHFFAVASQVMRRILVDYARQHRAERRGGGAPVLQIERVAIATTYHLGEILEVDRALTRLSALDERQGKIVEMRFFGGLTEEEIGEVLGISPRTVKRDWNMAKAWLHAELAG